MKKLIVITVVLFFVNTAHAQLIKDINVGVFIPTTANTTFSGGSKPFTIGYDLCPSFTFITKKTAHNVFYGFGSNSIAMLNAYFLPKNWDAYVVGAKSLHTKGGYLGVGIEKMEKIGNNVKFFEFCEFGTGFQSRPILTFGLITKVSWSLKK